jgi:hypothetical protein
MRARRAATALIFYPFFYVATYFHFRRARSFEGKDLLAGLKTRSRATDADSYGVSFSVPSGVR